MNVSLDAKWSAPLDDLLQDYVIQRAKQDLPGKVVGTPDLAPSARYRLALKVTDFGPVYADMADKAPRLDVALTATVIALPGETVAECLERVLLNSRDEWSEGRTGR